MNFVVICLHLTQFWTDNENVDYLILLARLVCALSENFHESTYLVRLQELCFNKFIKFFG